VLLATVKRWLLTTELRYPLTLLCMGMAWLVPLARDAPLVFVPRELNDKVAGSPNKSLHLSRHLQREHFTFALTLTDTDNQLSKYAT